MKFTLLKMRDIITNSTNNGFKANYSIIYMLLEAKYYIVAGVNLDKAKELFKNRKALINTKLSIITSNYQLALLDIKEKNFGAAKEKLMLVSKNNECLHVVRSAQLILDKIDNYIIKN